MQARDVMTTSIATVREAAKLMIGRGVSALPVLDQKGQLVGIISEGDLVRRAELGTDQALIVRGGVQTIKTFASIKI